MSALKFLAQEENELIITEVVRVLDIPSRLDIDTWIVMVTYRDKTGREVVTSLILDHLEEALSVKPGFRILGVEKKTQ